MKLENEVVASQGRNKVRVCRMYIPEENTGEALQRIFSHRHQQWYYSMLANFVQGKGSQCYCGYWGLNFPRTRRNAIHDGQMISHVACLSDRGFVRSQYHSFRARRTSVSYAIRESLVIQWPFHATDFG